MAYCPNPEVFGSQFLLNVEVVKKKGGVLQFYEVTRPESQPAGANKKKNKDKQVEVVATKTEKDTGEKTEVTPFTLPIQDEAVVPSTSAVPELSPEHASLVQMVEQQEEWRAKMEGLMERIALNTDRIALHTET